MDKLLYPHHFLKEKTVPRKIRILRNFDETWHLPPELYPMCFVSDRGLGDKPSGVRTELYRGPQWSSPIHSDSDISLHHYDHAPGRLPRCYSLPLQPPQLIDDLIWDALTQPYHVYTQWGPEAAGILIADFFVWQLPKAAWGTQKHLALHQEAKKSVSEPLVRVNRMLTRVTDWLGIRLRDVIYGLDW